MYKNILILLAVFVGGLVFAANNIPSLTGFVHNVTTVSPEDTISHTWYNQVSEALTCYKEDDNGNGLVDDDMVFVGFDGSGNRQCVNMDTFGTNVMAFIWIKTVDGCPAGYEDMLIYDDSDKYHHLYEASVVGGATDLTLCGSGGVSAQWTTNSSCDTGYIDTLLSDRSGAPHYLDKSSFSYTRTHKYCMSGIQSAEWSTSPGCSAGFIPVGTIADDNDLSGTIHGIDEAGDSAAGVFFCVQPA